MEAKLSHRRELPLPKFLRSIPTITFPSHCFALQSWIDSGKKHFRGRTEIWRFRLQEMSKHQKAAKSSLVHVVKGGETLTTISEKYGLSVDIIAAANKPILDEGILCVGQLLYIPASAVSNSQVIKRIRLPSLPLQESYQEAMNILVNHSGQKILGRLTSHSLPHVKTSGYFLVLLPLIAFCTRCIIAAFHLRISGNMGYSSANESKGPQHGSKSVRWRSVLNDMEEPDILEMDSRPNYKSLSEDEAQSSLEDVSDAYHKLERDYQKFLLECGISDEGYWHGGSLQWKH